MAVERTQFRVAGTDVGRRQGYLCYLRDKPYKLFLKQDARRGAIYVMAKTNRHVVEVGTVPEGANEALRTAMDGGRFVYVNESQIIRTSGSAYGMTVSTGWYA